MVEVRHRFPERLTNAVSETIKNDSDPVALQYLPDLRELDVRPEERPDPIGDHAHSPVKGIVHRHQNRVLLKASSTCAVNCRFCFRKTMLGTPEETLNSAELESALSYIETHTEIGEVILTGGDPLILSQRRLADIMDRLEQIHHVKIIRFHSRVPVADPARLDREFCALFSREKPVYMVVHVNHAQEITPQVKKALQNLLKNGVLLLSQSVLLKGINDNPEALENLFERLAEMRVKPYYLHHPDLVPGTSHFRVSIEKGQQLMHTLRARVSGLAMPSYVIDIPGGFGKVPLENAYIRRLEKGYEIRDHHGRSHIYP